MSFKAIIGENAPQVGMVGKENSIHVPDFPLVPICSLENFVGRINWCQFICIGFDSDARIVTKREEVVNNLKYNLKKLIAVMLAKRS